METARSLTLLALTATTLASSAAVLPGTNITVDSNGNYLQDGAPGGENSLASREFYNSVPGNTDPGNSNDRSSNFNLLLAVLENWNAKNDPDLPSATIAGGADVEGISGVDSDDGIDDINSYTAISGYDYVVFHFGNGPAGGGNDDADKGWWSVWYLGGASKQFNAVPQKVDPLQNVGGFSSARYFNGRTPPPGGGPGPDPHVVPDGGTTIASLGIALLGLSCLRRLIKKD